MPQVRKITRDAKKDNYTFASLVEGIVNSDAFRKQGPPAKTPPKLSPEATSPKSPAAPPAKEIAARSGSN